MRYEIAKGSYGDTLKIIAGNKKEREMLHKMDRYIQKIDVPERIKHGQIFLTPFSYSLHYIHSTGNDFVKGETDILYFAAEKYSDPFEQFEALSHFKGRINLKKQSIPSRIYVHENGFEEYFKSGEKAMEYCKEILRPENIENAIEAIKPDKPKHAVGELWADDSGNKVLELMAYGDSWWPGNPEKYSWVFKNGVYQPENRNVCCMEGFSLFFAEDVYRKQKRWKEYFNSPPDFPYFRPEYDISDTEEDFEWPQEFK